VTTLYRLKKHSSVLLCEAIMLHSGLLSKLLPPHTSQQTDKIALGLHLKMLGTLVQCLHSFSDKA
jgi:hypothetical protein